MATGTIKAQDLAVGDYLVSTPGDNEPTAPRSFTEPYPQVTLVQYGGFPDGRSAISYKLDIGGIEQNMLGSDEITISTTVMDDGKILKTVPAVRLQLSDSINGVSITDLKIVATTSDSVQHQYTLTDVVLVTE